MHDRDASSCHGLDDRHPEVLKPFRLKPFRLKPFRLTPLVDAEPLRMPQDRRRGELREQLCTRCVLDRLDPARPRSRAAQARSPANAAEPMTHIRQPGALGATPDKKACANASICLAGSRRPTTRMTRCFDANEDGASAAERGGGEHGAVDLPAISDPAFGELAVGRHPIGTEGVASRTVREQTRRACLSPTSLRPSAAHRSGGAHSEANDGRVSPAGSRDHRRSARRRRRPALDPNSRAARHDRGW